MPRSLQQSAPGLHLGAFWPPPPDPITLLQFRTDALVALLGAPRHQQAQWRAEYLRIADLLEDAGRRASPHAP